MVIKKPNYESIEVPARFFYSRVTDKEAKRVQWIVQDISKNWTRQRGNFLIAGVGGILRYSNERDADDIDLAIVGVSDQDKLDVMVAQYQKELLERMKKIKLMKDIECVSHGSPWVSEHGGVKYNKSRQTHYPTTEANSEFVPDCSVMRLFDCMGFRIDFHYGKPIDLQFVRKQTRDQWIRKQRKISNMRRDSGGKSRELFYAVLSQY